MKLLYFLEHSALDILLQSSLIAKYMKLLQIIDNCAVIVNLDLGICLCAGGRRCQLIFSDNKAKLSKS
jgi:hypothetical protein